MALIESRAGFPASTLNPTSTPVSFLTTVLDPFERRRVGHKCLKRYPEICAGVSDLHRIKGPGSSGSTG